VEAEIIIVATVAVIAAEDGNTAETTANIT
jgi:hypothetical protein